MKQLISDTGGQLNMLADDINHILKHFYNVYPLFIVHAQKIKWINCGYPWNRQNKFKVQSTCYSLNATKVWAGSLPVGNHES